MLFGEWDWDTAMQVSKEEGLQEGLREGLQKGLQKGLQQGALKMLCDLVVSGLLALTDAVAKSGVSQAEFMGWLKQFHPEYEP